MTPAIDPDRILYSWHDGFNRLAHHNNEPIAGRHEGPAQYSTFIYPYSQCEVSGYDFEPGHLRKCALNSFKELPATLHRFAMYEDNKEEPYFLYEFRTWQTKKIPEDQQKPGEYRKRKVKMIHGYLFAKATDDPNINEIVLRQSVGKTWRSNTVIDECARVLSGQSRHPEEVEKYNTFHK